MNSIYRLSQLKQLEAESIHIFRDAISQFENPVLLYSIGKDSSVLVHLAKKAFYPGRLPFKLLHIDSTFKFREMIEFRDRFVQENDLDLIVHSNQEGISAGVNPFTYGSRKYTDIMKTQALIQALTAGKYDAVFGGARRDEEKSRAKERIFSFRDKFNQWDPKNQRPELWNIYNGRINPGESVRIFPLSKYALKRGMAFGCKASGVKVIRIHDLRHSHVSLLINMGYSAVAIGNRVGHESVEITYRYAHLFPTVQKEMADKLNVERSN